MAYADQPTMSPRKAFSIGLVVLLHVVIGYAFVTGLAFNVIKKAAQDLKVVDIKDQPPPPEQKPPPPPPQQTNVPPPPIVAPPPIVQTQTLAPQIQTVLTPPPVAPPITVAATPAPAPPVISQAAAAKGNPQSWVTADDYPPGALREERQGVSAIAWTVNEQGRVENCRITASSGSPDLDEAACRLVTRRGRYAPAKDQAGNPIKSSDARRFRWQIPNE
ncbi:energy transducer TonB [Sphingomonas sp.]|uniref:energy transducer TonB n=1 Tax=Sphingomonas sp. TaxID=28214 RepID=UPI0039C99AEA